MYVIRNGPVHRQASQYRRGKLPRPIFLCCGGIGIVLIISGGVVLGIGQQKFREGDYTFIFVGAIVLGFGFILTVLAVFLSISWSTLGDIDYDVTPRRSSTSTGRDHEDMEMNGYRGLRRN